MEWLVVMRSRDVCGDMVNRSGDGSGAWTILALSDHAHHPYTQRPSGDGSGLVAAGTVPHF